MTMFSVVVEYVGVWILAFIGSIFNGFALSMLWSWFFVPTFGVPSLDIIPAIGFTMVVHFLTYHAHRCKKEEMSNSARILKMVLEAVLKPLITLFFGWIVHLFM